MILSSIMEILDSFKVDQNIGMLLTIILSGASTHFKYGQLVIQSEEQMSFFLESVLKQLAEHLGKKLG